MSTTTEDRACEILSTSLTQTSFISRGTTMENRVRSALSKLADANLVIVDADRLERLQQECRSLIYRDHVFDRDLDPIIPAAGEKGGAE